MRSAGVCAFRRHQQWLVTRVKAAANEERSVAANRRVDEELGEALGLRLRANENCHTKYDADEAEQQGAFAMSRKTQRDVKGRRHRINVFWKRLLFVGVSVAPGASDPGLRLRRDRQSQGRSTLLR